MKVMKRRHNEPPDPEVLQEDLSTTDEDEEEEFMVHYAHTGLKTGEYTVYHAPLSHIAYSHKHALLHDKAIPYLRLCWLKIITRNSY